jgi:uncharacterized membrane protein YhaH (DUF805 family)
VLIPVLQCAEAEMLRFLFSFNGRFTRLQFWLHSLVLTALLICLVVVLFFGYSSPVSGLTSNERFLANLAKRPDVMLIAGLFFLALVWSAIAGMAKRYHDRGKSGWWIMIMVIPYVGPLWQIVECGFLPGTRGSNRFDGPDEQERVDARIAARADGAMAVMLAHAPERTRWPVSAATATQRTPHTVPAVGKVAFGRRNG